MHLLLLSRYWLYIECKISASSCFSWSAKGNKGKKITFLEALCLHLRLWPVYSDIIVELVRVQVMVTTRNYGIHVPCTVIVLSKVKHPQGIPVYSSHISINYRIMLQAMYTKFSCSYTRNIPITLHSRQLMLALIAAWSKIKSLITNFQQYMLSQKSHILYLIKKK